MRAAERTVFFEAFRVQVSLCFAPFGADTISFLKPALGWLIWHALLLLDRVEERSHTCDRRRLPILWCMVGLRNVTQRRTRLEEDQEIVREPVGHGWSDAVVQGR